ncbi:hypothetical protein [Microbacterium sp. C7(2022)]|uniref:hypothetical protein n=1 Tax=Microbacterium sp. C7(2022) TaxID=2992759 RepID=UPI00237BD204|nr:hypothetical protein [Microbacterium sp. C7(2022)]MDE0546318.1 hypothetical protein [Microbacterium sp. C7(2022)]
MKWTADVSAGDWLRARIDDPWAGTMHDIVPRGFTTYTRIFHPATRSKPADGTAWPALPYEKNSRAWEEFTAAQHDIDTVAIRWHDAADAFGTRMHADAQWGALVRAAGDEWNPDGWQQVNGPDGWQYDAPGEGQLAAETLAAVMDTARAHTSTPHDGYIAVWEGWGGLVGGVGYGPARSILTFTEDDEVTDATAKRHRDFLAASAKDLLNNVFRRPSWQPGILPDDVSKGPRLQLPNRGHVLFEGDPSALADPSWVLDAPWRDREMEQYGAQPSAESPSIIWPADRAWVMLSEVDWDSTIVAGSVELARALCADPRIEAGIIREGAMLTWSSDEVNR